MGMAWDRRPMERPERVVPDGVEEPERGRYVLWWTTWEGVFSSSWRRRS